MDANGTRFHLLLGYHDWANCLDGDGRRLDDVWSAAASAASPPDADQSVPAWDSARGEITLQKRVFQYVAAPNDTPPVLEQRRGSARDRYGNWYWIDDDRQQILVNASGDGRTALFWPAPGGECPPAAPGGSFGPLQPALPVQGRRFGGLTVTEEHYLVVGLLPEAGLPAGLLIFDLHAGGPPQRLDWPADVPLIPFDMAPMPGGGVWILDRDRGQYWALDRWFNVLQIPAPPPALSTPADGAFAALDGSTGPAGSSLVYAGAITSAAAMPLTAVGDPIAIAALPDCTVLILDRDGGDGFATVHRFEYRAPLGMPVSLAPMAEWIEESRRAAFSLRAHDFAFVPEHPAGEDAEAGAEPGTEPVEDRLYVVAADGNQAFAFAIGQREDRQLTLEPIADYFPLRLFGGKGLAAAGGSAWYDFGAGWIPVIAQPRPRYVEQVVFYTDVKDGYQPDCVWHRMMVEACIPPGAAVRIWSRAADDEQLLHDDLVAWQAEPALYRRGDGSELPFAAAGSAATDSAAAGVWELLFQNARGRHLQLRIELSGNRRVTPRVQALRIYYPRFSYLRQYLPAIYREDELPASFLDRYLANPEGIFTAIEDKIAAVQMLFDVRSAPPETLDWLASWFGVALDPAWDEARRRLFIRHAMDFFQWRGTARGLLMALRLTLDECPDERIFTEYPLRAPQRLQVRIVESYRTRTSAPVALGDATDLTGIRQVAAGAIWQPAQGGARLQQLYTEFLAANGRAAAPFPTTAPADAELRALWGKFTAATLGFTPRAGPADLERWQAFLLRRYQRIGALNTAYGRLLAQQYKSFDEAPLPDQLPGDGPALVDWRQFETIVLAMLRTAHRFSVLVGLPAAASGDALLQRQRLELARRVVNLEKPAHTVFDVRFFWALFRVGAARLGEDTLLDRGSRAPQLMPAFVLGQNYLAEGFLTAGHPQNVAGRQVAGSLALPAQGHR